MTETPLPAGPDAAGPDATAPLGAANASPQDAGLKAVADAAAHDAQLEMLHAIDRAVAAADAADRDYATGFCRPPRDRQWKKGQSGNPAGRPPGTAARKAVRRAAQRLAPGAPTGLERALRRHVRSYYEVDWKRVSLPEMIVNQLTKKVAEDRDVAAARELRRWMDVAARAQEKRARIEDALAREEEVIRLQEEAAVQKAHEKAEQARLQDEKRKRWDAIDRLKALAMDETDAEELREEIREIREARAAQPGEARASDPEGGVHDLHLHERALVRLGVCAWDGARESITVAPWVIEAAQAKEPDMKLTAREKAVLALATATPGDGVDWEAKLAELLEMPEEEAGAVGGT